MHGVVTRQRIYSCHVHLDGEGHSASHCPGVLLCLVVPVSLHLQQAVVSQWFELKGAFTSADPYFFAFGLSLPLVDPRPLISKSRWKSFWTVAVDFLRMGGARRSFTQKYNPIGESTFRVCAVFLAFSMRLCGISTAASTLSGPPFLRTAVVDIGRIPQQGSDS